MRNAQKSLLLPALLLTALLCSAPAPAQISDDFSGLAFNDSLWTFVNPVGDGSYFQANGRLTISVPAGTPHDLWPPANDAARVVRSVADTDLSLDVKFESEPTAMYQMQGLLLEAAPGDYIRLELLHDGLNLRLFCATFVGHAPTVRQDIVVSAGAALWLRIVRTGDSFAASWSADGTGLQTEFTFSHTLELSAVGVYAGNAGTPAPAHDAVVDYFFDTNAPIDPEDGSLADIWAPVVTEIVVAPDPASGTALVSCTTNEPATTVLSYGPDATYGTDIPGTTGDGYHHEFVLTGLVPGAVVHFSIAAADTLANSGATADRQFPNIKIKPVITVWGGLDQRVGHLGTAQADFNLMGNVLRWEDLATLTYSLNGGPDQTLNWGSGNNDFGDYRRLAHNGDFNVDLPIVQLQPGANTIAVRAEDIHGNDDLVTATVTLGTGTTPLPTVIDWDTVTDPQDVGQSADGNWTLAAPGLRTVSVGYDRIFLVGETTWQDYEVVCPITLHSVQAVTGPMSDAAGLGFLMRFTGHIIGGHRNWPYAQPKWGYQPFGALGWLRWTSGATANPTVQFYRGDSDATLNFGTAKAMPTVCDGNIAPAARPFGSPDMVVDFGTADKIVAGDTFWFKMRCETLSDAPNGDGVTRYSFKVWSDTAAEPSAWNYEVDQQSPYALRQGSVGLLAHHVDVTFGDVVVSNLNAPTAVGDERVPPRFELAENHPNPFNPLTHIAFEVPQDGRVQLAIFDIRGRHIVTLMDENLIGGRHEVVWNGTDAGGRAVSSGSYIYRLEAAGRQAVKKLLILK